MSLADWQQQLSQALLRPDSPELNDLTALKGVEGHRVRLYEELLFNTVLETLQSIYPYTYALLSRNGAHEADWRALADDYRRRYPNCSHKLMGAVSGFSAYLAEQPSLMSAMPYLADMALYEWLEMEVMNLPDQLLPDLVEPWVPEVGQLDCYSPAWNLARRLHTFDYNIPHLLDLLKASDYQLEADAVAEMRTEILIYRDPVTMQARFFCLNELTASLMRLSEPGCAYQEALMALRSGLPALGQVPETAMIQQARQLFVSCLEKGMLLGSLSL